MKFSYMMVIAIYSALNFSKRFRVLSKLKMDETDSSDASGKKMLEEPVLNMGKKPLIYIRYTSVYIFNTLDKKMYLKNVSDNAIHAWKKGASAADSLRMVNYNLTGEVLSYLTMWTKVKTNVWVLKLEKLCKNIVPRAKLTRWTAANVAPGTEEYVFSANVAQ